MPEITVDGRQYTVDEIEALGHNPSASWDEILKNRENFSLKDTLAGVKPTVLATTVPFISRDAAKQFAQHYGFTVLDEDQTGLGAHNSDKMQALVNENAALLDRCKLAEAAASGSVKEIETLKAQIAMMTQASEPAPESTPYQPASQTSDQTEIQ